MLNYGRANKMKYVSDTDDMFEHLEQPENHQTWKTEFKWTGPGRTFTMNRNVNWDKNGPNWTSTNSWDMKSQFQTGGLTMQSTYNNGNGKMSGAIDWGECYPNLHYFTGLNHSA